MISSGTAESKPTTSIIPASSGSAMVNSLLTIPTTTSFAGMPDLRRYCRRVSTGWMFPAHVSESVRMMKQSTFIFCFIASSMGKAQSVRPKGKSLVFCMASEMLSDAVMFRGDMTGACRFI